MQTVFITGGAGFLAQRAAQVFTQAGWRVECVSRTTLDITDKDAVRAAITHCAPQAVLHCAAISDTGLAQRKPELSFAVNVQATAYVAGACRAVGAKLVYLSSDQVYNGCLQQGLLPEDIALSPQSVYAVHKLEAEQTVAAILPDAVGLRLPWMYDAPQNPMRQNSNLLRNLQAAAESKTAVQFAVHEMRGITNVWDIARALPACVALPGGIYNLGGAPMGNTYETARFAAKLMSLSEDFICADTVRFMPTGRNLSMDTQKIAAFGIQIPATEAGLLHTFAAKSG